MEESSKVNFNLGKKYQSNVKLRTAHSELWEDFLKKKSENLPPNANVDEEFIKWIEDYIKNYYYMLPGETALDADLRRIAFRNNHSYQWESFCENYKEFYGCLPYGKDKEFEKDVKRTLDAVVQRLREKVDREQSIKL